MPDHFAAAAAYPNNPKENQRKPNLKVKVRATTSAAVMAHSSSPKRKSSSTYLELEVLDKNSLGVSVWLAMEEAEEVDLDNVGRL